jgi:hypothetical protein
METKYQPGCRTFTIKQDDVDKLNSFKYLSEHTLTLPSLLKPLDSVVVEYSEVNEPDIMTANRVDWLVYTAVKVTDLAITNMMTK